MRFIVAIVFSALLSGMSHKSSWKTFHLEGLAQGTTWHITYYAADSLLSKAEIESVFASIDSSLSIYKNYSLISRFNSGTTIKLDAHFSSVLQKSMELFRSTGGIFDITVQPLMEAWGFRGGIQQLPDSVKIKSVMRCVGSERLYIEGDSLKMKSACVQLDVNGIAQGYSVDVLARLLEQKGIRNYLVELGGEIRISGRKQPSGECMSVGIETPTEEVFSPQVVQTVLRIDSGALTTSGSYRNYVTGTSKKITHLIDARTGYPAENNLLSVTVWAKDAMTADGYDHALMVMGLEPALRFLERQRGMEAFFIYKNPEGKIRDTATRGFKRFMEAR
jgi:thiamine biosynthesis lipoprotein